MEARDVAQNVQWHWVRVTGSIVHRRLPTIVILLSFFSSHGSQFPQTVRQCPLEKRETDKRKGKKRNITYVFYRMGAKHSKETRADFELSRAYGDDYETVKAYSQEISSARNVGKKARVLVRNSTQYHLKYLAQGADCGHFRGNPTQTMFQGPNSTIEPGKTGFLFHSKNSDAAVGAQGYVSFRVECSVPDGDPAHYVVCVGWCNPWAGRNSCGAQIRLTSHNVNDKNRPDNAFGVNVSGVVTNIKDLACMQKHAQENEDEIQHMAETTAHFQVSGEFTSLGDCLFFFDVKDRNENPQASGKKTAISGKEKDQENPTSRVNTKAAEDPKS